MKRKLRISNFNCYYQRLAYIVFKKENFIRILWEKRVKIRKNHDWEEKLLMWLSAGYFR